MHGLPQAALEDSEIELWAVRKFDPGNNFGFFVLKKTKQQTVSSVSSKFEAFY